MTLRDFPLLSFLTDEQIGGLELFARYETDGAGDELMQEGESGSELFLLLSGEVEVRVKRGKSDRVLTTISAPAVLGEMELLTGQPRSASVVAVTNCRSALLQYDELRKGIDEGNVSVLRFVHKVAQVLAGRLASLNHKLGELEAAAGPARAEELKAFKAKLFGEWSA